MTGQAGPGRREGPPQESSWRNFRDVTDLPAIRAHGVRRGMIYRSAAYGHLDLDAVRTHLEASGIRRVVDLRAAEELDPAEESRWCLCERRRLPLIEVLPRGEPVDRSPPAIAGRYFGFAESGVGSTVQIVELLAGGDSVPTLFHCMAGRDRTGIVVASILDLLGVPDEAIGEDYALSHVMDDDEGRHASPENILGFLERVRDRYGSMEEMLMRHGAGPGLSRRLREALIDG